VRTDTDKLETLLYIEFAYVAGQPHPRELMYQKSFGWFLTRAFPIAALTVAGLCRLQTGFPIKSVDTKDLC